jgi:hypothetical protein
MLFLAQLLTGFHCLLRLGRASLSRQVELERLEESVASSVSHLDSEHFLLLPPPNAQG